MFFFHIRLIFGLLLLLLSSHSHAVSNPALEKQRTQFQLALKALQNEQFNQFHLHKKQLADYPLKHYLEYRYLRNNPTVQQPKDLTHFIKQNSHSFYADRLRNTWLDKLAKNKQWSDYLNVYQVPQNSARQCTQLTALIKTGKRHRALKETTDLWLIGKSQHKNCDVAFQFLKDQGKLTEKLRWQRLQLAVKQQQFSLANYLAKSTKDPAIAKKWLSHWQLMTKNPLSQLQLMPTSTPLKLPNFLNAQTLNKTLIEYGLTRLAQKSTEHAFRQWQRLKQEYKFSITERHTIQGIIATRAALNRQDRTLHFYGETPHQHWRARATLWQQDWPATQKAIRSLSMEERNTTRWQYWLARSYAAQGQQRKADKIYHKLMLERDYYGFLSADKLGKKYHLNHQPLPLTKQQITAFSNRLEIQQLHEFYVLSMNTEARQQAYYLKQILPKRDLEILATLTHDWGWHDQTIALLSKAKSWNDLNLRFPVIYEQNMIQAGKQTGLDPSWLLGVVRQESAFNVKARSRVGARGLMQLMPKTARSIARRIKAPLKNLSELVTPRRNIQLGSAYLRQVYDEHQKNPVLATASYNAGPSRVTRWLPEKTLPADIWIENIPFNETRKYTANVISYAAIFDYQRKQKITPLLRRMPAVQPKN